MRGGFLIAVLLGTAQAVGLAAAGSAHAAEGAAPAGQTAPEAGPTVSGQPPTASPEATGAAAAPTEPVAVEAAAPPPPHPVVAIIRQKLADPAVRKDAESADVAALEAFYGARSEPPLWITEMGFSAKGQAALFEIETADDWGLDGKAFDLPQADALPANEEAQARAEIKLDVAILKYARFARGGRLNPQAISDLLDQTPPLRDPKTMLAEIEAADAPDAYLQSLHPRHEPFVRLRQALLKARGEVAEGAKAEGDERDMKRIVMNMERWRWMPEDLGSLYVWSNTPEFMLYVVKDGKTIYADKTLVGTIGYPTPIFSADMATIVFNPDWIAPESVLEDKLLPALRRKHYSILKSNKLRVSYQGKPVDAAKVDWGRVNIHNFTFIQKAGPTNVLGKAKFLHPNKHVVYMHDTLPYRRKVFKEKMRAIGYGCVRMEQPKRFAEILLAEDKDWPASKVKDLWEKGINSPVTLDKTPPVHTTYFTAVVDDAGKVATFSDLYGIDRKMAVALFGNAEGFPVPPPEPKRPQGSVASASARHTGGGSGIASSLGFLDE
jgi:murein L,D-transpeptidase YcbB/YkuD